ncbi:unnamed protein product, partial [Mesorhabditis belari]|uniref:ZP domain-containing protein n=1 Tax=Mesorhabditis belari TaxID=2138241 RepID=A0AAF3ENQ1_9BILA
MKSLFVYFLFIQIIFSASNDDLVITIKSTRNNHYTRLRDIAATWLQWLPERTYVISDAWDKKLNETFHGHFIATNCTPGHFRKQLSCKMGVELRVMMEKSAKWSCHFDDDNYVNVPRLKEILGGFNYKEKFYIGRLSTGPITAYPEHETFIFATGGAGICLSHGLLVEMSRYIDDFEKTANWLQLPDDVTLGYIINYLLIVNVTENFYFHSHFDSLMNIPISKLKLQASLSGMNGEIIHNVNVNAQIEIDNGVVGDPLLQCGDGHIEIRFETRAPFRGLVFVEDRLNDPSCRSPPSDGNGIRNTSLKIAFEDCGTQRVYSQSPRGLFISTKVLVAFHPEFLTKFDRLYYLKCFYMEMERRLQKQIQISMPPPTMHRANIPMPICRYEVLDGGPTGPPVLHTIVGQMVGKSKTFELISIVDDGNGDRVTLLDDRGCARDKYLLNNLEYINDLMAGREAHVYKYADRENMYFDCEITISIKEPGNELCEYPNCPNPPRRRRFSNATSREITVQKSIIINKNQTVYEIENDMVTKASFLKMNFNLSQFGFCASSIGAIAFIFINLTAIFLSTTLVFNTFANLKSSRK